MATRRYMTHAIVLVIAIALSGYATIDKHLPSALGLRLGVVNADGLVIGEGGDVNGVQLGRLSTIIKPAAVPAAAPVSHSPVTYTVQPGENLDAVAGRFHVSVESIRWSNWDSLRLTTSNVSAGDRVVVPPVSGVVVTAVQGDTAQALADRYKAPVQDVLDFNYLRGAAGDALVAGTVLVIPSGQGSKLEEPTPPPAPVRIAPSTGSASSPSYVIGRAATYTAGTAAGNRFDYGYCTWYVASRRPVPWIGDAWMWYGNARAAGWATGPTPRPGAIMVTWESGWGHVALVESVAADGSWTVSEMNFQGWGVISTRTIRPGGVPLIGFIY